MWLLDVNLPNGLAGLLHGYGISCDTAARRDWRDRTNGAPADAAFREGFRVILTRDRLFGTSARRALAALPEFAIVVLTLPQAREKEYLADCACVSAAASVALPRTATFSWTRSLPGTTSCFSETWARCPRHFRTRCGAPSWSSWTWRDGVPLGE